MTIDSAAFPAIKAPFPWFGGKRKAAHLIWQALGDPPNYCEPFAGSAAALLARPPSAHDNPTETINDADGFVANFWRAMVHDPEAVAYHAEWPVNEADLHARHVWLVGRRESCTAKLMGDAEWFDAKVAGWWVWGICSWIGTGWCSGQGPWQSINGELVDTRQLPHLSAGQGINRKLPHLGDAGQGINRKLPHLGDAGKGINRQLPHLSAGRGTVWEHLAPIAERLRHVRVACGDWQRILGPSPTYRLGLTGILLDPPYGADHGDVYATDSHTVIHDVLDWCRANGSNPGLRIVLCCHAGQADILAAHGWTPTAWAGNPGYGATGRGETRGKLNRTKETLWLSPHCLRPESAPAQPTLPIANRTEREVFV